MFEPSEAIVLFGLQSVKGTRLKIDSEVVNFVNFSFLSLLSSPEFSAWWWPINKQIRVSVGQLLQRIELLKY
jgi:hypothetical protein